MHWGNVAMSVREGEIVNERKGDNAYYIFTII